MYKAQEKAANRVGAPHLVSYSCPMKTTTLLPHTEKTPLRLILAPMEGVMDGIMRDILTRVGGFDRCVTEFVRISQTVLPKRVFLRICPELAHGGHTAAGVPVFVQLLGSDPELMAANAKVAVALGAPGIDLNFGCPAKTVNKSQGGAVLLKTPGQIEKICSAVRDAVPPQIPVTAKIRLGFDSDERAEEIANATVAGGVDELTVHARTRRQGYRPPAHWHRLADIGNQCPIPINANGELWTASDVLACGKASGTTRYMLARGALCRPDLALSVRATLLGESYKPLAWEDVRLLLIDYLARNASTYEVRYACNPTKQWLVYLQYYYPQAGELFAQVKRINDFDAMMSVLERSETSRTDVPTLINAA